MSYSLLSEVLGNPQSLDGGAMFGNAPRAVWQTWIAPDERGRIPLNCRAMLLECDGKKILCETGVGAFFDPKMADRYGVTDTKHLLLENLNALGIQEDEIDFVILSHLHFDHAGGLLPSWEISQGPAKKLLFPNAHYVVGKEAYERAESPHPRDRASFIPELNRLLASSGRLIIVSGERHPAVLPNRIRFFLSHGHTPGHMHTVVQGERETITFAGDLIPGRAWVHLPITMGYDRFAEQVIDEKADLYKKIADQPHQWIFYTHDHEVALSRVVQDAKGKFTPSDAINHPIRWAF